MASKKRTLQNTATVPKEQLRLEEAEYSTQGEQWNVWDAQWPEKVPGEVIPREMLPPSYLAVKISLQGLGEDSGHWSVSCCMAESDARSVLTEEHGKAEKHTRLRNRNMFSLQWPPTPFNA